MSSYIPSTPASNIPLFRERLRLYICLPCSDSSRASLFCRISSLHFWPIGLFRSFLATFTMRLSVSALALAAVPAALAQQTLYGQCGGIGWSGATTCVSGSTCVVSNQYYSQCLPGTAPTTLATSSKPVTTSKAPIITPVPPPFTTPSKTTGGTTPSTTIPSGGSASGIGPGTTLQSGYYWIRSVESPNFHKYLQTSPEYTTGTALMGDYTTAGQFQIVDGQLVELIDPTKGTLLYATVAQQSSPSESTLPLAFTTTPNTYGTFAFQGDAVTWTVPSITRQNTAAWYVCTGQQLFINLGAYDYGTPANCADETVSPPSKSDRNVAHGQSSRRGLTVKPWIQSMVLVRSVVPIRPLCSDCPRTTLIRERMLMAGFRSTTTTAPPLSTKLELCCCSFKRNISCT